MRATVQNCRRLENNENNQLRDQERQTHSDRGRESGRAMRPSTMFESEPVVHHDGPGMPPTIKCIKAGQFPADGHHGLSYPTSARRPLDLDQRWR